MSRWNKIKLGYACHISKGQQFNKIDLEKSGNFPCINGGIEPSGYTDKWNTEANTITISEGGNSCGFVNFLQTRFWSGGHCYSLLSLKDTMDVNFLYQALKGRESLIMRLRVGSGLPNIQQKAIKEFEFEYPEDVSEQIRIAQILAKSDSAIAKTEALIAKYQRIKTGLMQDLLTKGIDEKGNIRNEKTHRFKTEKGLRVPKEWNVKSFKECCELIKDGTHLPPRRVEEGIWLLGVTNIINGEWIITPSDTKVSEDFFNQMHKNWKIEKGDVLLAIVGATIGKVTQVPPDFSTFTLQRSVCLLRGKKDELHNDYLRLFIESKEFQRMLWNEVNVTAQPGIYLDAIGKFQLLKPDYYEQIKIANKINTLKNSIDYLKNNLHKLQSLKTGLMQDLLSGKVRVKIQ